MSLYEHPTEFAGKTIVEWKPESGITDPGQCAYRIGLDWDEGEEGTTWTDKFGDFLQDPRAGEVTAFVVGSWAGDDTDAEAAPVVEALVAARDRMPRLSALFLGDIISEENEISWIHQADVSPLFESYPLLEHLQIKGGNGLSLGVPRHSRLKSLVIQTGGLSGAVVREVGTARLPALEHLELWLGDSGYGGDSTVDDLRPVLAGDLFPRLTYLGLCDSEFADAVAVALADAPVLRRLRTLDLSLGTLGDEGAKALLASPFLLGLGALDIHHHYCSEEMTARLQALPIAVNADERETADQYGRYVAVSE